MKLNYDFYKGNDEYSDGDIEKELIDYMKDKKDEEYNSIFNTDMRWPVFYHLTQIRENILNWYPMKKDAQVLEIGAGMGAITGVLCKKAGYVTAVELSKQRATAIATRHKNKENLEIIVANLNDVEFDKKFDYITLIGVYEYAGLYTNSKNPYIDFINNIKKYLKDDGKLLIAIENKFGMKYFLGAPEDHTNISYDGILGYESKVPVRTFGKNEFKNILSECGFNYTKFYYPLPDYKLPNVIFSDEYLPNEEQIDKLYMPYYYDNTIVNFDEKKVYKQILKENKFDFFANSYFIECSMVENNDEEKVDFALFNSTANIDKLNMITKSNDKLYKEKIYLDKLDENKEGLNISNKELLENYIKSNKEDRNDDLEKFFSKKYLTQKEKEENLKIEIEKNKNQVNMLKEELEKIYHSRTWKYTNVIRKLNKKINKK